MAKRDVTIQPSLFDLPEVDAPGFSWSPEPLQQNKTPARVASPASAKKGGTKIPHDASTKDNDNLIPSRAEVLARPFRPTAAVPYNTPAHNQCTCAECQSFTCVYCTRRALYGDV